MYKVYKILKADNLHGIKEISTNLTNLVDKSKAENQQLETTNL